MTFIQIGSYVAPGPLTFKVEYNDLDGDGSVRNEKGEMKDRDRLRADVFKVSASFELTIAELSGLAGALKPKQITVTLFDLTTAEQVQKKMYASSKTAELVSADNKNPEKSVVKYSCNLIEM